MKYAVVTYVFGNKNEKLREPLVIDEDTEYICVTDQNITSKHWKIVKEMMPDVESNRDKVVYVKFNPFKYTDANMICVCDGSLEIKTSLKTLFAGLNDNDILIKKHPGRNNLADELRAWQRFRGLSRICKYKFEMFAAKLNYDLRSKFLLEGCLVVYKNNDECKMLCESVIEVMKLLGENGNMIITNQCPLTLLLQTMYKNIKYDFLNQKEYFNRYVHGTERKVE